jgi:Flp pilus assembly protein TadD
VRYPGQPLPDAAFVQPTPDLPGLLWMNRPAGEAGERMPDLAQLQAYFTAARKDPSLWPLWFRKLTELSTTKSDDPTVLNSLGAVALAQKKDNAEAALQFARALKAGSEEPTTYLNLATALENLGHGREAENILEQGVALYPWSSALNANLALAYTANDEAWRARSLVEKYRAVFPEDAAMRAVEKHLDAAAASGESAAPARSGATAPPR